MTHRTLSKLFAAILLVALPSLALAGPPLICHPFQTSGSELLPWTPGTNWNNPDPKYNVERLPADLLRVLTSNAPVVDRMENMRRAAIYVAQNAAVADQLLQAVIARASGPAPSAIALFDAGYLIESYKQANYLHRRSAPTQDGYAMVVRAISTSGGNAGMEFAASLMTQGAQADAHLRRARAAADAQPLLAKNIDNLWK